MNRSISNIYFGRQRVVDSYFEMYNYPEWYYQFLREKIITHQIYLKYSIDFSQNGTEIQWNQRIQKKSD